MFDIDKKFSAKGRPVLPYTIGSLSLTHAFESPVAKAKRHIVVPIDSIGNTCRTRSPSTAQSRLPLILNSRRAVEMGIYVVRAFVDLRELLSSNKYLIRRLKLLSCP